MGGRGASSGISDSGKKVWGRVYHDCTVREYKGNSDK